MARTMKDSGVDWIGEIPADWEIQRGKNILTLLERPVMNDDGVITCFRDGEVTLRSNRREEGFTMSDKEIGYQGIEIGDLVVHGMDGFAGAIGISDSRGKSTPVLNVMDSSQYKRYLMHYLRCAAFCGLFLSLATGIRVRSCDTNWNKLKNVLFALPPIEEQKRIASFLDTECARIDSVIEKTRASIEEYKKLKQAVITQSVTKGIRPNRTMKDSGIDWIGKIPADWEVIRIKYIFSIIGGNGFPETLQGNVNSDYPFCKVSDINGEGDYVSTASNWVSQAVVDENRFNVIPKSSIIMAKIGAALTKNHRKINLVKCCIDNNTQALVPKRFDDLRYLLYLSKCIDMSWFDNNSTIPSVNNPKLLNFKVSMPPIEEQKEITAYLDEKCNAIDELVTKKQTLLAELESYKKSLIFEYVTGKKEVTK